MTRLLEMLRATPYAGYTYAYPHKTAYRPLQPPRPLHDVWAAERRDSLFLYLHVPFCEMRCGFCNLFTTANPAASLESAYLDALERHARAVRAALGPATFARMAIGGGTPTYLEADALRRLFELVERLFHVDAAAIPVSVETSPHTAEAAKLRLLRERGVDRISIGVQSFVEEEARAAGRPQQTATVEAALTRIREAGFPTLNVDLIYGLPGQTAHSFLDSLSCALHYAPEELYLYPLYVRPLTGLGRRGSAADDRAWDDLRLACYRAGRSFLLQAGYTQVSMRMFRAPHAPADAGPVYCCQEDGMVGLGCGARSYTRGLHYSSEYAVGRAGVRAILARYVALPSGAFAEAGYGMVLDRDNQSRRYVIQSLLQVEGLSCAAYRRCFDSDPLDDLPQLAKLVAQGLATQAGDRLQLTEAGLERSDTIGPQFPLNNHHHPSLGRSCRCGHSVISVDGAGTVRRCHFIKTPLANIYEPGWEAALRDEPCTNATCSCHIGYVHMDHLGLREVFGDGILDRIPTQPIWQVNQRSPLKDQVSATGRYSSGLS